MYMEEAAIYNNLTLCYLGVSGVYGLSHGRGCNI
jgi:hypothetical protein